MLGYKEQEDLEARLAQVESAIDNWQVRAEEASSAVSEEFRNKLIISLLFHDSALEGEVLSYSEIKAAIDKNIISDASLIPGYETTNNFHAALTKALAQSKPKTKSRAKSKTRTRGKAKKNKSLTMEIVRGIYADLQPKSAAEGMPYRKDNPLHRLYYHDIVQPHDIEAAMNHFNAWLERSEFTSLHPVEQAATAHWRFMAIFPWLNSSGRVARILSNYLLEAAGLPLAVIHSIDRQRYYEALKIGPRSLYSVYLEAVEATATAAVRVYDESAATLGNRRQAS